MHLVSDPLNCILEDHWLYYDAYAYAYEIGFCLVVIKMTLSNLFLAF